MSSQTIFYSASSCRQSRSRPTTMAISDIPKQCKAGVVVNEGPDFRVEVQMVDVPSPGMKLWG